jgi:perosamine synthetase
VVNAGCAGGIAQTGANRTVIPYGQHHIDEDDIQAVVDCLRNGIMTQGPKIEEFEQAVATYVGARYAVAVSSGTAALHLAMLAAGVQAGDAVVTSPITFVASANAAQYVGAKTLFADIDADTINISPTALKKVLNMNSNVRVVIPVHFAGLPCDMDAIKAVSDQAGALIVEDAAHALGAYYSNGQPVGCCSHSLMTIFSFHPVKAIAAGEGGMITTNDENVYRSLLRLRSHGINKVDDGFQYPDAAQTDGIPNLWYYEMQELGFNYRITDIQCSLGLSQLSKLERFVSRRRQLVMRYDQAFADIGVIRPAQKVGRNWSAHHLYAVQIDFDRIGMSRALFMSRLRERNIISQVHYIPVPAQPYYRQQGFKPEDYPNAQHYYYQALSLPLFVDLAESQQDYIISLIDELLS